MNQTKRAHVLAWRRRSVVLALLSVLIGPAAFAGDFSQLVVFGDSLSDPGNHFIEYRTTAHQPYIPLPDDSYAIGGHHFSNGATWVEQLATALQLPTSGGPALRNPGVFTNYAVGRARARANAPVFPFFDLSTQVNTFLADVGGVAPSDVLYVVWIGSDDLTDALMALQTDPSGATSVAIIGAAVAATVQNIQALWVSGARTFFIPTIPNAAITPFVRSLGPAAELAATQLSTGYNAALDQSLGLLQGLPGIELIRFDIDTLLAAVIADPEAAGFANVDDACLTFFVTGDAICSTPNRYMFWDGIHPTTTAHGVIADAARQLLTQ